MVLEDRVERASDKLKDPEGRRDLSNLNLDQLSWVHPSSMETDDQTSELHPVDSWLAMTVLETQYLIYQAK